MTASCSHRQLCQKLEEALSQLPVLDVHSHLVGGKLAAQGLHDVLLYHMVVTELYSAGCPSGARLTQYPAWPDRDEAHARLREALPYLPHIANTSIFWGVRTILADLYGWREPITADNFLRLDSLIRERAADRSWPHQVLDKVNIQRTCTELARRGDGSDDDRLQFVLEWGMFARCQWGEFDTALYELERAWGLPPQSPAPIAGGQRPATARTIRGLADVHAALDHYLKNTPVGTVLATAMTLSTDIHYRVISDQEMIVALKRRHQAGPAERDIYASYILERYLSGLEAMGSPIVFQFALGAEPLPYETASRLPQSTIDHLAQIVSRHPRLRFECFLASRHGNQSLCTLCRELPNLSMVGYWWHNFFPDVIRQLFCERLDMLPANRQIGFFSDAYCVDWAYAKLLIVRKQMVHVLAGKIAQGQYSFDEAVAISRSILFDSPRSLLGMQPRVAQ